MRAPAILGLMTALLWIGPAWPQTPVRTEVIKPSETTEKIPEPQFDLSSLPKPVQRMREQILEAAQSGDLENLRPVIEMNEVPPSFTVGSSDEKDAVESLRKSLDDDKSGGLEILAILIEILEAGFVRVDEGTPQEMYVWPWFAQYPLDKLTPEQKVQMFRVLTSYDYQQMESYGSYIFYRLGIGPDGTWHFFLTGH